MKYRYNSLGWLLTFVIALLPIGLWFGFHPSPLVLTTTSEKIDVVAKLAALAGVSLFAWEIILSARTRWLNKAFFGLDKLYKAHHLIGGWVLLLLMLHAGLISTRYAMISLTSGYEFLKPHGDWPILAGEAAMILMVGLLIITFYLFVSYERFVLVMRLLGAVFLLAVYHVLFNKATDLSKITPLRVYLLVLMTIAVALYIYRSLFHGRTTKQFHYKVAAINPQGQVNEVVLSPQGRPLRHYAGQFAFVQFDSAGVPKQQHPFTISSGSNEKQLRFSIKNLGDFTSTMKNLKVGDPVTLEGPYGQFSYSKMKNHHQIWIAGGIGITPFLSMARSLESNYSIDLFYSVKDPSEAIFLDELKKYSSRNNFRLHLINSSKEGFLTADRIVKETDVNTKVEILLCGPVPMMKSLRGQLKAKGYQDKQIHSEEFSL